MFLSPSFTPGYITKIPPVIQIFLHFKNFQVSALIKDIFYHEPDILFSFPEAPKDVGEPVFSVRHIDPDPVAIIHKFFLKRSFYAKEHLEFKPVLCYLIITGKFFRLINQSHIVCRNGGVAALLKEFFYERRKISFYVLF